MTDIDLVKDHCGFCDRDIIGIVRPPTFCTVTVKSDDHSLDATYSHVCMQCAVEVVKTMGSQRRGPTTGMEGNPGACHP